MVAALSFQDRAARGYQGEARASARHRHRRARSASRSVAVFLGSSHTPASIEQNRRSLGCGRNRNARRFAMAVAFNGFGSLLELESFSKCPRKCRTSHQKRPHRTTTIAIELKQNHGKISDHGHYSAAHNGLVAGSSPAGPTTLRPCGLRVAQPRGNRRATRVRRRCRAAKEDGLESPEASDGRPTKDSVISRSRSLRPGGRRRIRRRRHCCRLHRPP